MIKLEHIHFTRDRRKILSDVCLEMKSGEHWVILGKNGSGKSTLLEMINGYLFPSSGRVEVLGNVYGTCDVREARRSIGYISQSLMEKLNLRDPAWEVVATGEYGFLRFYENIDPAVQQKAIDMLHKVRLGHLQNQPLGLLSQGERKKIMLARAMMTDPSILIMDEPCAGLDLFEREHFLSALEQFEQQDVGMVYVTHHIEEIVPVFTHVVLIEQGQVVAAGKKQEVLTPELIYQAYQVPVDIEWHRDRPWIKVQ
jgi:iron complex transport system ATP-binding protein